MRAALDHAPAGAAPVPPRPRWPERCPAESTTTPCTPRPSARTTAGGGAAPAGARRRRERPPAPRPTPTPTGCGGVVGSLDLLLPSLLREFGQRCFPEIAAPFSIIAGELGDD